MNFQDEWDDTFEADLLKLRASVANAFTEVSLDNSLPQKSVDCSTHLLLLQELCLTGFLILENQS